ncbi:Bax inhibitor-1/YccA family protein [Mycoplasmatota bacterium]|nr:Bax inhibitor-1/YccA family protein [Mycoplasmatota bacterium]
MRTANPVFRNLEKNDTYALDQTASYQGITLKTLLLLLLAALSGYYAINYLGDLLYPVLIGSVIVGFISVMIATFNPRLAMPFGIIYALSEGVLLGTITVIFNDAYPGVALTAIIATASIFTVMLFLYSSRVIRVTSRFRRIMTSLMFSLLVFFVIFGILSLFNVYIIYNTSIALGVSVVLLIFASVMLTLDFDNAERIVEGQADKTFEWVVAVGLMVTLVWIYIELLRILAIATSRRN